MFYLQAMTPEALSEAVPAVTIEEARKIIGAIHRRGGLDSPVPMVRRLSLDAVRSAALLPRLQPGRILRSPIDSFVKYCPSTADGHVIETVRIPLEKKGRYSVCVSSQAGCGLGCTFCATGRMGLRRNLETWEIVEQVRMIRSGLDGGRRERVHGVVFQGMGEPLANVDNVIRAIRVLCNPSAQAIDSRAITVCTAGLPDGIRRLARDVPNVRLSISIGSARSEVRRLLMPVDRAHSFESVLEAAMEHARLTRLAPMWALTLLAGVNDNETDALALARCAGDFARKAGVRPQISIISYNPIGVSGPEPYSRSCAERESAFRKTLLAEGFISRRRYSGGADVRAACGQLAAQAARRPN